MKRLILLALMSVLCATASTVARAQEINPKLKIPDMYFVLPDLVVSSLSVVQENGQSRLKITVKNICEGPAAKSHVSIKFKTKLEGGLVSSAMFFPVKPLKGGESETQNHLIGNGSYSQFIVEVDTFKKLKEVNEGNNWRKVSPDSGPEPGGSNPCKRKN